MLKFATSGDTTETACCATRSTTSGRRGAFSPGDTDEFYQTQLLPARFQAVATGGPGEKLNDLMLRVYLRRGHSVPRRNRLGDTRAATPSCWPAAPSRRL